MKSVNLCFCRKGITFLSLLALVLLQASCKGNDKKESSVGYATLEITTENVETDDEYPASIQGRQDVAVYPQISGKITHIDVKEGQHVRQGQTLFVIDQVPYRAALQTAIANMNAASANTASAQLTYDGKLELYQNKVGSQFELRKAKAALLAARAQQEQTRAAVTSARNDLSYTIVKSPSAGVIGTLNYRIGALVSASSASPLTMVSDNAVVYAYFSIPENRLLALMRQYGSVDKAIAQMPVARMKLNDGSMYQHDGHVESISGVMDTGTGSTQIRAAFPNAEGLLHSGGAGSIILKKTLQHVVVIPQSATYEIQDKVFVYRMVHGKTKSTPITVTALPKQNRYVVNSGLHTGDVIVTDGVSLLQDNQPIHIKTKK